MELIPEPHVLAALLSQLLEGEWPRSADERENLFERLEFTSGERLNQDSGGAPLASFRLTTDLPGNVRASWGSYEGQFLSIDFHLYASLESEAPATRAGHDALWHLLAGLYGPPIRPWEHEEVPPSIWHVNGREVVMHFFNKRDSAVMLSISDTGLAAAADAGHTLAFRRPDSA